MNDEIIKMAQEAGLVVDANQSGFDDLERFFHMAQAAEREKLKNVALFDMWYQEMNAAVLAEREAVLDLVDAYGKNNVDLKDAIRARGQQ